MLNFLYSLKSRLLFLIFIVTLPGLIAIIYQAMEERKQAINSAQEKAVSVAFHITSEQSNIIIDTATFLKRLSKSPKLLNPSSSECSEYLGDIYQLHDDYTNLGAPNVDGQLICNALPLSKLVDVSDRPYIQKAITQRQFSVGRIQFDRVAKTSTINFAYPVINPNNDQVVAAVVAVISLDWWSQKLKSSYLPDNTVAYIVDAEDKVIAIYPENPTKIGKQLDQIHESNLSIFPNQTQIMADSQGFMRIFVNRELINDVENNAVNMIVGIPFGTELDVIDARLRNIIFFVILFIVMSAIFTIWVIEKSVLKPLKSLEDSTKQLELGLNQDEKVLTGTKELTDLQKHFSSMAKTRLMVEQQLKGSQAILSRHLQNTPLGAISWNKQFVCTEWNKAAEKIFNYSAKEAIGQNIIELIVDQEMQSQFKQHYQQLLKQEGGGHFTATNITKNGKFIHCNWYNTLIVNSQEEVTGIGVFVKDISEEKRNRDALNEFFRLPMNLHLIVGFDSIVNKVNEGWKTILGYSAEELIGHSALEHLHPEDILSSKKETEKLRQGGDVFSFENRYLHKNGEYRLIMWSATASVEQQSIYCIGVDITERRLIEDKLKLAAGVFTHAKEAIIITNQKNQVIDVNNAFIQLSGYSRNEVIGKTPSLFKSEQYPVSFYKKMWQQIEDKGYWSGEIWNKCKNGELTPQLLTISSVSEQSGQVKNYIALYTDITDLKAHQKQLEHIAHFDVLTNLPNRSLLAANLNQAMALCRRQNNFLAVAFLDLDGFKEINDYHGHSFGDQLLVKIAERMQLTLRDGDTLSRFGGDEFVAIFVDLETPQVCEPVLERLLAAVSKPVVIGEVVIKISASIGVTIYPNDNVDAEQLLRHADQAMYSAKQEGKNRFRLFDMAQDIAMKHQHESLQHIQSALENNEFILHYQPKVNMNTGEIVGAEALIRWQHPERGLLMPAAFLPIIQRHELIIKLGEWVIDNALAQISSWYAAGLKVKVSVNIDALHLQQDNFATHLSQLLDSHSDVDPNLLQLEVLETSQLSDLEYVSNMMNACIKLGVGFAIDDFGTGYCSLTYLKKLPVDVIKIDQTFIRDMLVDPDDLSIVEGVMGLSKAFRREVIAEGVESLEHGCALLNLGCFLAQGYGIAKPMPAKDLIAWVENWRPSPQWTGIKMDQKS